MPYTDDQAAQAVLDVIGNSRWEAVGIAHGFIALRNGATKEEAARAIFRHGSQSLKKSREVVEDYAKSGYVAQLTLREERGAAADVVPKLFPGRVTEERFLELLDDLSAQRKRLAYLDHRGTGHGLDDFILTEGELELPLNVKVASTQFLRVAPRLPGWQDPSGRE